MTVNIFKFTAYIVYFLQNILNTYSIHIFVYIIARLHHLSKDKQKDKWVQSNIKVCLLGCGYSRPLCRLMNPNKCKCTKIITGMHRKAVS